MYDDSDAELVTSASSKLGKEADDFIGAQPGANRVCHGASIAPRGCRKGNSCFASAVLRAIVTPVGPFSQRTTDRGVVQSNVARWVLNWTN